jgi:predicted nucleic acid-binding protein
VLRLVADTNIVVSALLWHGAPHRLFETIKPEELCSGPVVVGFGEEVRAAYGNQAVYAN